MWAKKIRISYIDHVGIWAVRNDMYGICDNCENFVDAGKGEASCELGHEMIRDREECDDFEDYTEVSGEGTWSLD